MTDTTIETHNGHRVRLSRQGSGDAIILLHGYPENLLVFSLLASSLSETNTVINFDWPGMGDSEAWKGGATPLVMARRLLALMDGWQIEKAHIIGQDMGAQPALVFAAHFPSRTKSVVVMNALTGNDESTSWEIKLLRRFRFNHFALRHFPAIIFRRALHTFLVKRSSLPVEIREDIWSHFRKPEVRAFISRMCAGYEAQLKRLPDWYKEVKCPVLILWGENDKHFPPAHGRALRELIPHASMHIIAGGGHWMVVERHMEIAKAIQDFHSSVSS